MKKAEITDIFFDLDDTLWDFKRNAALTFDFIFAKRELSFDLNSFLKVYEVINDKYWKLYRSNKIDREGLRFHRLAESFQQLKWEITHAGINELVDDFKAHLADFNHLLPEAIEVLEYLSPKYKLHILTNGFEEVQRKKLLNSNLYPFFHSITTSEENGIKKPSPEIFELALKKAKTSKENSLMIGDNFEADILGAQAVGLKTIYFQSVKNPDFNGIQISQLNELKKLL